MQLASAPSNTVSSVPANSKDDDLSARCRITIMKLVEGFAVQDIDTIMDQFAETAVYCDVLGEGARGDEYRGKEAIRAAFVRGFALVGPHTYEKPTVVANGHVCFASWTLVLGDAADPSAPRFEGADHFELDEQARVLLKKAWLKGQPRLARTLINAQPSRQGAIL
jgi:ketosteroid isomerase-like protein